MRFRFLRLLILAALAAVLVAACGSSRGRRGGGGPDDGSGPDAGSVDSSTIVAPPGELALAVESAAWGGPATTPGRDLLYVGVRLGNGSGAAPASLDPALFGAQTSAGTEVVGAADVPFGEACSADLAVAAGANRACGLVFRVPTGETPTTVVYRATDGREATAPIAACSPASPGGLCDAGRACLDGNCLVVCSEENPDGSCASPDEVCRAGTCVGMCSPTNPDGACEEGACVDGVCDTSCLQFTLEGEGCIDCVSLLSDSGVCGSLTDGTCSDTMTCALCPFDAGADSCTCTSDPSCEGCESTASEAWTCIAAECPSCVL